MCLYLYISLELLNVTIEKTTAAEIQVDFLAKVIKKWPSHDNATKIFCNSVYS